MPRWRRERNDVNQLRRSLLQQRRHIMLSLMKVSLIRIAQIMKTREINTDASCLITSANICSWPPPAALQQSQQWKEACVAAGAQPYYVNMPVNEAQYT